MINDFLRNKNSNLTAKIGKRKTQIFIALATSLRKGR